MPDPTENATLPPYAERCGYEAPADTASARALAGAMIADGYWATDPPGEPIDLDGVRALRFAPAVPARATVLHFHGGGYRVGCPEMIGPYAAALAKALDVEVICPAYRLAPDHPAPAAINDAWRAWTALDRRAARPLLLAGDSAGGGLAASLTLLAMRAGRPPGALVLVSPWLDLTLASDCFERNAASDPLFSRASAMQSCEFYLQGMDATEPTVSPLLGIGPGFPPTFVSVGTGEVLADDARRLHAALRALAIPATLCEVKGMEHVAVTRGLERHGAAETFSAIVAFIGGRLASDGAGAARPS